ncbi:unnamed protein product [Danaus chrysippus]|uniref:(African queen) hypothetical protein n=1 Tax=Danaus chrysippus TaxID=151541 RepID=A0A8J2W6C7_9NEOP|nr:unnamed protein product [Danaus chrysippus]
MESHILNMYHQAPYRNIGHNILRSISESLSSEGSCNQNSPEQRADDNEMYWTRNTQVWSQNQNVNITQSNQDISIDGDENIEVQEVSIDDNNSETDGQLDADNMEENSLVEGDDYDIIQVFAVDPDLDLECSSDEEQEDFCIPDEENTSDEGEYINPEDKIQYETSNNQFSKGSLPKSISQESLELNFDAPVVSNVDEYFIKQNDEKHILEVKDEPVVNDVDEYFIKDTKDMPTIPPPTIVEELLVKSKLPETDFRISKTVPDEIFEAEPTVEVKEPETVEPQEGSVADVSINESDLEVLPNIEDLKRYLLDDLPYTKLKNVQKSYSVSLPHSPMHNILDIDSKTCLSFEDLNLDLSDLTFENEKEKSSTSLRSDDMPRTLTEEDVNSFLITNQTESKEVVDDCSPQDMEIDRPLDAIISNGDVQTVILPDRKCTSTPIPKPNVLEFCIEKVAVKKEPDIKVETDDFVDVESCNDAVIPVLEANNLNSLLEQFEATEKLNKRRKPSVNVSDSKTKTISITSGMRLQDAGVQLNKTKMRQILMPSPINTVMRRSPSPIHSDHDYCSSKKRLSLPNLKGGQSLLKPEVLSSNNKILSSRHRSCKNKKVIYHLSSDDESDANTAKKNKILNNNRVDDNVFVKNNKKSNIKLSVKATANSNHRKKLSPPRSVNDCDVDKDNGSVMVKNAFKASDTSCSQNCNGSIKLTIKNKSEVIIKNCDFKDNRKDNVDKNKLGVSANRFLNNINNSNKGIDTLDRNKTKDLNRVEKHYVNAKQDVNSKEHFYTALINDKQDVEIPQIKSENNVKDEQTQAESINDLEQPQKKKKLNLQEYKLRRNVSSNASSAQVSPEAIFPDIPCNINLDKNLRVVNNQTTNDVVLAPKEPLISEAPKTIFDPIREASRKILMNSKKQKAEAMRKRDEDIVMSKIPKVENLELQPLISDAEMMKIVGMTPKLLPVPIVPQNQTIVEDKVQLKDHDEIVLVSIGTNTDENMFKIEKVIESKKRKSSSPKHENKLTINFKIKKSDPVLKQNVFDTVKRSKSPINEKNHSEVKIDKERLKDITATLKSVEKQVDTKISSNSLFASIQDVVMKNAPTADITKGEKSPKHGSVEKRDVHHKYKTSIVRQYDINNDHGEDKIILHLEKNRKKPDQVNIEVQTDSLSEIGVIKDKVEKESSPSTRKRNDSDMSMSSDSSPVRAKKQHVLTTKDEKLSPTKSRQDRRDVPRSQSKEKRCRSTDRYDVKYRRSRSHSRGHRRKRSNSRNRSRSRGRFRRYRRSDSPYRRKRRSRTRSPYRSTRRSPSVRKDYRSTRTRSRSKHTEKKSKSPIPKKRVSPQRTIEKPTRSLTPPLRKPTVSESSDSSSSSSSSGASSASIKSRSSCSPYKKDENFRKNYRNSFSSEDRESNTPVEERRIVFVGRLEKDLTKAALRAQFTKFGPVTEVRLHSKEDGSRYGFVTFQRPRDAWSAVEAASSFPQYDVGFGGRRAFCRQSYADLDGLEAKYTESAFHGQAAMPVRRNEDMSFEQMLLDIKKKLNKRKGDKSRQDDA